MNYAGDIRLGDTIDVKFTSRAFSTGAPTTLAGTPVISAYPGNSTTQLTAGITLTVDFDGVTGLHNVRVVATSGNGYATATNYALVITTGTVGGVSVVGEVVGSFSIEARSALMPTVAGRTLDVAATGEAGLDYDNILLTNGAPKAGVHASGTLSGTHSATTADLGANAPGASTIVVGMTLYFPVHALSVVVTSYNTGTGVATFEAITATLVDGNVWFLFPTAASVGGSGASAADVWAYSDRQLTALDEDVTAMDLNNTAVGSVAGAVGSVTGNVGGNVTGTVGSVVGAVGSVTGNVGGNVVGSVASVTGNVGGNVVGSVASVTGAVGSVTGNVGGNVVGSVASVAGAVGSVTGNVGGNVTGSVGSVAAGGITAASFGASAITAAALATDAANEIADAYLDRDMSTGTDSGSATVRTPRQALRAIRNKVSIAAGTLTVCKEDDATSSWTGAVTTTAGNPISAVDPAGP